MLKRYLVIIPFFILSCASVAEVNSFRDPDYRSINFNKLLIQVNSVTYQDKQYFEHLISNIFKKNKISCEPSVKFLLPTRLNDNDELIKTLLSQNFSAILKVTISKADYDRETLSDGEIIEKPYFYMKVDIYDYKNNKTAWTCDGYNGGNSFASLNDIYIEFFNILAQKMIKENIVLKQ
jgi:hypothetical protein